jgi:hypothetical protein
VALAEKAYAEANGYGFVTTRVSNVTPNVNSYDALGNLPDSQGNTGGQAEWALPAITRHSPSTEHINPTDAVSAWNAGQLVVLCTNAPPSSYIQPHHYYALVNYNSSNGQFILFNPYGTDASGWQPGYSGTKYGLFWANAGFLSQNFDAQVTGGGGGPSRPAAPDVTVGGPGDVFAGLGAGGGLANALSTSATLSGSPLIRNEANGSRGGAGLGFGAPSDATPCLALTNSLVNRNRTDGAPGTFTFGASVVLLFDDTSTTDDNLVL